VPLSPPEILGPSGPLASRLGPRHESRPQQLAMASAVATALDKRSHLLVEAGTGVGKSFAYLVPAIRRVLLHQERVVIATNTIALQEQLIHKDIPFLMSTLGDWGVPEPIAATLRPVLVKGRGNYVSLRRLELASSRALSLFPGLPERDSLDIINEWAAGTTDGSLSTLPAVPRPGVWDRVQSDSANCMGRKCPKHETCFYQKSRREMEVGNLLVCNHAVFFADLALRSRGVGFIPHYHHVILDEAHAVEDVASEHFGLSLTESRVAHLLNTLYHIRTGKGFLAHLEFTESGDANRIAAVDNACKSVLEAEACSRMFFEELADYARRHKSASGRVDIPDAVENALTPAMRTLSLRLKALRELVKTEADKYELNAYTARAASIADEAEALVAQSLPGQVYWIEAGGDDSWGSGGGNGGGGGGGGGGPAPGAPRNPRNGRRFANVRLACAPVDVAPLLREHLFSAKITQSEESPSGIDAPAEPARTPVSVTLTSATLATRAVDPDEPTERAEIAFAHVMSRLGVDDAKTLQLDSPFDYANQAELYIDSTMPSPRVGGPGAGTPAPAAARFMADQSHARALAARILHHVKATRGGAFVLFTSFATLNACADLLAPKLADLRLPLIVQGRDGPRSQLLTVFKDHHEAQELEHETPPEPPPGAVLFGAASFWQGVDVPGRALRNVIITRLPFEPPDRPLTQARLDRIKARGGNPFAEDSLPRAVLRFKQGFGRLIRTRTDHGRVVVLDPRLVTTRYGRAFVDALPAGIPIHVIEPDPTDPAPDYDA
jgi:ATP-dependent DNA helicase DinG